MMDFIITFTPDLATNKAFQEYTDDTDIADLHCFIKVFKYSSVIHLQASSRLVDGFEVPKGFEWYTDKTDVRFSQMIEKLKSPIG